MSAINELDLIKLENKELIDIVQGFAGLSPEVSNNTEEKLNNLVKKARNKLSAVKARKKAIKPDDRMEKTCVRICDNVRILIKKPKNFQVLIAIDRISKWSWEAYVDDYENFGTGKGLTALEAIQRLYSNIKSARQQKTHEIKSRMNNFKDFALSLDSKPFGWLDGRSFSDAFVICIGAGPWRFPRRKAIQKLALDKLAGRDLSEIKNTIDWYPLKWQNTLVDNMRKFLISNNKTMEYFCLNLDKISARQNIFDASGCHNGSKVLSLFCRDALKVQSFPIDRHVRRFLEGNNLPNTEQGMIDLCNSHGLDPAEVAVGIVREASDMDNPDWSVNV